VDVALGIAMDYLERTGQALNFLEMHRVAASAIAMAWKGSVQHRIKLAGVAVKAVERKPDRIESRPISKTQLTCRCAAMMEYRDIEYTVVQSIERVV
jgi:hypothetical protein